MKPYLHDLLQIVRSGEEITSPLDLDQQEIGSVYSSTVEDDVG